MSYQFTHDNTKITVERLKVLFDRSGGWIESLHLKLIHFNKRILSDVCRIIRNGNIRTLWIDISPDYYSERGEPDQIERAPEGMEVLAFSAMQAIMQAIAQCDRLESLHISRDDFPNFDEKTLIESLTEKPLAKCRLKRFTMRGFFFSNFLPLEELFQMLSQARSIEIDLEERDCLDHNMPLLLKSARDTLEELTIPIAYFRSPDNRRLQTSDIDLPHLRKLNLLGEELPQGYLNDVTGIEFDGTYPLKDGDECEPMPFRFHCPILEHLTLDGEIWYSCAKDFLTSSVQTLRLALHPRVMKDDMVRLIQRCKNLKCLWMMDLGEHNTEFFEKLILATISLPIEEIVVILKCKDIGQPEIIRFIDERLQNPNAIKIKTVRIFHLNRLLPKNATWISNHVNQFKSYWPQPPYFFEDDTLYGSAEELGHFKERRNTADEPMVPYLWKVSQQPYED